MTQPAYGMPPATPPVGAQTRRNPLGVVSLIIGASISVISLISQLATAMLIGSEGIAAIQVTSAITAVITGLLALAALGLGIAGLLKKGAPKAAAGAGTALGGAALVALLGSLLYSFFLSLGYA